MADLTEAMLTDIYDAWRLRNLDWLASYLPDDFCHSINIPGELYPLGGVRRGKRAAVARLRQIFQEFDTREFEIDLAAADRRGTIFEIETLCLHRPTGTWLHSAKRNVWRLEDGWPVTLEEVYDLGRFKAFLDSVSPQPA
jgi:SnoaL-like protein